MRAEDKEDEGITEGKVTDAEEDKTNNKNLKPRRTNPGATFGGGLEKWTVGDNTAENENRKEQTMRHGKSEADARERGEI